MGEVDEHTRVFTNHNVYILGAGFSADAGVPLVNEFLYEMRASLNLLREMDRERERKAVVDVLTFRKEAASAALRVDLDVENIEDLFSLAAASSRADDLEEKVSTAIAATIDCSRRMAKQPEILATTNNDFANAYKWKRKSQGPDLGVYAIPSYDFYAGLLAGDLCKREPFNRNTIITFNYDTVLEEACDRLQIPIWYGLNESSVIYDGASTFAKTFSSGTIPVLKLHGSVNWARPDGEHRVIRVYRTYDDVRAANEEAVLVPPTWRKIFAGALRDVWNNAVQAISEATRIVIIGFSMPPTDIHFKYLLAAGLQENISLRNIHCFNPDPSVEENLFRIVRPALKNQRIASFHNCYMKDLVIGHTGDFHRVSDLFNRSILDKIRDING